MKIYFIYHSCFIIETNSSFLMFDFFKNKKNNNSDFNFHDLLNNIFKSDKPLYIFASHSHRDHYNKEILDWQNKKENIYYILSSDIKIKGQTNNFYFMNKNENTEINNLEISSFGSTDEGISFLIKIDGLSVFHAGDLNWWKWPDDTDEEEKAMEDAFKEIVDDIYAKQTTFDVVFFPVDGRLKQNYLSGGQYFIEKFNTDLFIPMHFGDEYEITRKFKESQKAKSLTTNIKEISQPNQLLKS